MNSRKRIASDCPPFAMALEESYKELDALRRIADAASRFYGMVETQAIGDLTDGEFRRYVNERASKAIIALEAVKPTKGTK